MNDREIFKLVCDQLRLYEIKTVSEVSGVSLGTLYHWLKGHTKRPQLRTVCAVIPTIGLTIEVKRKLRTVVHKAPRRRVAA